MDWLYDLLLYLSPWLIVVAFIMLFFKLTFWVQRGRRTAVALGFVLQAFLPNLNIERRIDVLAKQEQADKDNQNRNK